MKLLLNIDDIHWLLGVGVSNALKIYTAKHDGDLSAVIAIKDADGNLIEDISGVSIELELSK